MKHIWSLPLQNEWATATFKLYHEQNFECRNDSVIPSAQRILARKLLHSSSISTHFNLRKMRKRILMGKAELHKFEFDFKKASQSHRNEIIWINTGCWKKALFLKSLLFWEYD